MRDRIAAKQNNRCFYCQRELDFFYMRGTALKRSTVTLDHVIPFSFVQNHRESNLVACCSVCNMFKSSIMFDSVDQIISYLKQKWDRALRLRKIVIADEYGPSGYIPHPPKDGAHP